MNELHNTFLETIGPLGMTQLETPIFYNAPIGISFEIGSTEKIYLKRGKINLAYIEQAFNRVSKIYHHFPASDLLRIVIYPNERIYQQQLLDLNDFTNIGLPLPKERVFENIILDEEEYEQEHLYWELPSQEIDVDKLLTEIIKSDIGGFNELASAVYFINTKEKVLFYLYDDRGLDVVVEKAENLKSLYDEYHAWILDYDRDEIDIVFAAETLKRNTQE